jgi:hypothetical protein
MGETPNDPARAGLRLTGEDGPLIRLTRMVVEGALEGEMGDHLAPLHAGTVSAARGYL